MNIRSTDKNLNRLKILLDDLQKNPDIILLQEIWQDNLNFKIAQYKKFTTTRIGKKGGGTAILIKDSFKPSEIKELTYIKNTIEITNPSLDLSFSTTHRYRRRAMAHDAMCCKMTKP